MMGLLVAAAGARAAGGPMTEDELSGLYLRVLESAVDVFEPLWTGDPERPRAGGFYDFRTYPDWRDEPYATIIVIPGNGMIQFCYSILLNETDKDFFGEARIPRETLWDHTVRSMRWCCLTSAYVDDPYPYLPNTRPEFLEGRHWRRQYSYRADEVGWLTMAAANLWPKLDGETKSLLLRVFEGGAPRERIAQRWAVPQGGNHDQVKQDFSSTMGAAYLLPPREAAPYREIIAGNAIDMVSTLHDFANPAMAEEKPISEWARGWNLYQDYSSDHHGWCNLWYGGDMLFEGRVYAELLSALTGRPVPETFAHEGNGFAGVLDWLKNLYLPAGEPLSPHGNEYDAYYGLGLLAYAHGAVIEQDPAAAAMEEGAARLLESHAAAIRKYDYHRNSWAKAGMAYLLHKHRGPRAEPASIDDAMRQLRGVHHYRWLQQLLHRGGEHIASFAWGSVSSRRPLSDSYGSGLCGFVFPAGPGETAGDPLAYCHPASMIGEYSMENRNGEPLREPKPETRYRHEYDDTGFSTAGFAETPHSIREYAFFSFEPGAAVLLSRFRGKTEGTASWTGMPVYFFAREGLTGTRTYFDAGGSRELGGDWDRETSWWCVDGRLAAAAADPSAVKIERSIGYNWARQPEYKDRCDGVFFAPFTDIETGPGEPPVDRAAVFYANTPPEAMARQAEGGFVTELDLPEGWRAAAAAHPVHGGLRFLAVANFSGADDIALALGFPEGAPVTRLPSVFEGPACRASVCMKPMESRREVLDVYLAPEDGARAAAQRVGRDEYRIEPLSDGGFEIAVTAAMPGYRGMSLTNAEGRVLAEVSGGRALRARIDGPVWLRVDRGADGIAPAVELAGVEVREDNLVTVEANAADESGVALAELWMDGQPLGAREREPYVWMVRPEPGAHTFQAFAADASPAGNRRESFKRTVVLE